MRWTTLQCSFLMFSMSNRFSPLLYHWMNFYSILGSYEFLLAFVEELFFLKHFIRHKKTKKQKNLHRNISYHYCNFQSCRYWSWAYLKSMNLMELSFDTCSGFCINSCVWKQWSFAISFIGFLWQYMTIVYIKCASSISNVHKGIASGSQHQNVNHRLFNIVSQIVKRIACGGNI
jgi:hypothetical protein